MNKYKTINLLLIVLVLFTVTVLIVSMALESSGKISSDATTIIRSVNMLSTSALLLYTIWYRKKKNTIDAPEYRVNARIIGKRKAPQSLSNPLGLPQDGSCFIAFAFDNGFVKELTVPVDFFISLHEDKSGLLTFKEKDNTSWFVGFQIYQSH